MAKASKSKAPKDPVQNKIHIILSQLEMMEHDLDAYTKVLKKQIKDLKNKYKELVKG